MKRTFPPVSPWSALGWNWDFGSAHKKGAGEGSSHQSSTPPSADIQLCPWVFVFLGWAPVGFHGFFSLGVVSISFCILGMSFHGFLSSWGGFPWLFFLSFGGEFLRVLVFLRWFYEFLLSWDGFLWVSMFFVFLGWLSTSFHRNTAWLGFKGTQGPLSSNPGLPTAQSHSR